MLWLKLIKLKKMHGILLLIVKNRKKIKIISKDKIKYDVKYNRYNRI